MHLPFFVFLRATLVPFVRIAVGRRGIGATPEEYPTQRCAPRTRSARRRDARARDARAARRDLTSRKLRREDLLLLGRAEVVELLRDCRIRQRDDRRGEEAGICSPGFADREGRHRNA